MACDIMLARFSVTERHWYEIPYSEFREVWWSLPSYHGIPMHTDKYELHARISKELALELRGMDTSFLYSFPGDFTTVVIEEIKGGDDEYSDDYSENYMYLSIYAGSRPSTTWVYNVNCKDRILDLCTYQDLSIFDMEEILYFEGFKRATVKRNIKKLLDTGAIPWRTVGILSRNKLDN